MRRALLISVVTLVSGAAGQEPAAVVEVSLIQLIARPSDFDGQRVRVVGYVTTGFEEEAIFLNPQDYENGILDNSVRIVPGDRGMPLKSSEYALVEGVFHAKTSAHHVRGGVADIDSVTRIEPWYLSAKAKAAKARGCW